MSPSDLPWPLRFGVFHAPFHEPSGNPTLAFRRDLELVEHLDQLGIEEAWFGEHHSSGWELINAPDLMVAAAAERTTDIRLGTGAISLSYHHPFLLADRIVQLDHMTRGRLMFGVAPGALPSDAAMMGVSVSAQRRRMEESMAAIVHLMTDDEPLTMETDWFLLREARLQLRPYSHPGIEMAITSVASPNGPRLAARYGAGILSVGATTSIGFDALAATWDVMEAESALHGTVPDRRAWRLTCPVHLADSEEQARADVRHGLRQWYDYWSVASLLDFGVDASDLDRLIDALNDSGFAVIGTPDRLIAQIDRLLDQSRGGFGAFLVMTNDWAAPAATRRSFELLADAVAPRFQHSTARRTASFRQLAEGRDVFLGQGAEAAAAATAAYQAEVATRA